MNTRMSNRLLILFMSAILEFVFAVALTARAHEITTKRQIELLMNKGYDAYDKGDMTGAVKQFLVARTLCEQHDEYKIQCLAAYNLGTSYFHMMGYSEALDYYFEALELCDKYHLSTSRRLEILYGIAGVFFEQNNYKKAKELVVKVYDIARDIPDSLMCENSAFALAMLCNKDGEYARMIKYLDIASSYGNVVSHRRDIVEAEALHFQKKYPELKRLVARALKKGTLGGADLGLLYFYRAEAALAEKDYPMVFAIKNKAIPLLNMEEKSVLYGYLAQASEACGDFGKAMTYKDSAIFYRDSLYSINNKLISENSDRRYEIMRFRIDKEREISDLRQRKRTWVLVACIALLLGIIALIIVAVQRQRTRHRNEIMRMRVERQREQKILAVERMKESELIADYRQKLMEKDIERKNAELLASSIFVSSRNKLIRDLLKYIDAANGSGEMAGIRQITGYLNRLIKDNNDEETFRVNFDAANPGFSRRLLEMHPELLPNDLRFLAYVRMNMSTKEIASMLNINPESCKRRKIRLSKKLGLESSADLYAHVLSMTEKADEA